MLADPVSGEGPLSGLKSATFLLYSHMKERYREDTTLFLYLKGQ
jgi:hypothetical protein